MTLTQGDIDLAITRHEAAIALSSAVGDNTGIARSTGNLCMIAYYQGEFDRAIANLQPAHDHYQAIGDDRGVAVALHALSAIALDTDDTEPIRCAGKRELGAVVAARATFDEPTFADAWAMGQVMSIEQAVAEATAV